MDQVRAIVMALEGVRLAIIAADPTKTKSEYANSIVQSDRAMRMAHEIVQQMANDVEHVAQGAGVEEPTPMPKPGGPRRVK